MAVQPHGVIYYASAAANTVSLGTEGIDWSPGDRALVMAHNTGGATAPTAPDGWTSIRSDTIASTAGSRLGERILQTGDTSIGTWTNATHVQVLIVRGHDPAGSVVTSTATATGTTVALATLTPANAYTLVLGMIAHASATDVRTRTITPMVTRSASGGATTMWGGDTGGGVATFAATAAVTVNASDAWRSYSVAVPMLPTTAGTITRADMWHYADDAGGVLTPIYGPDATFVRDTGGYLYDGARFVPVIANQPKFEWTTTVGGRDRIGLLLEPAGEPENADPFDVSAWTSQSSPTVASALSVIRGQVATRLTATESASRKERTAGTFTNGTETVTAIVEGAPGALSAAAAVRVRNTTSNSDVVLIVINFATGATPTASSGTIRLARNLGTGPNGGTLWLVRATYTGTTGNSRGLWLYPALGTGSGAAIFHAAWISEAVHGANPAAGITSRDALTYPVIPAGAGFWFVIEGRVGLRTNNGGSANVRLLHVGDGETTDPRFSVVLLGSSDTLQVFYDDGSNARAVTLSATLAEEDHILLTGVVTRYGQVRAQLSVNGGALVTGASSGGALATTWGGTTPLLRIAHASSVGGSAARWRRFRTGFGALTEFRSSTSHAEIHALLRGMQVSRTGEIFVNAA